MSGPTRWGFSIFCEDIRVEVGEKSSWMGIFRKEILIPDQFPVFVNSIAVIIKYYENKGSCDGDLEFRVYGTDDVIVGQQRIGRREIAATVLAPVASGQDENLVAFEIPFIFAPMVFEREGFLKVRMYDGVEEVKLGSIRVRAVAQPG